MAAAHTYIHKQSLLGEGWEPYAPGTDAFGRAEHWFKRLKPCEECRTEDTGEDSMKSQVLTLLDSMHRDNQRLIGALDKALGIQKDAPAQAEEEDDAEDDRIFFENN